jgi:hypothetical protein
MFGWDDLREHMAVTPTMVQCPVRECSRRIPRQRKTFCRSAQFRCPDHAIYVSASTFEYEQPGANMLWSEPEDLELWRCITQPEIKRESRVTRDNSEDAVTWNVFRYLEKQGLLARFISEASERPSEGTPRIVYWSWCQQTRQAWQPLVQAALGFGEASKRRSEPDLIIEDDATLFFVESKFTSSNQIVPSDPTNAKKYETGFDAWFRHVFQPSTSFKSISVEAKLYELMRLWLLGSRIAFDAGKRFVLVNVVREGAKTEVDITKRFERYGRCGDTRGFTRLTWERVRNAVVLSASPNADRERLLKYYHTKTLGYAKGQLRRAFR